MALYFLLLSDLLKESANNFRPLCSNNQSIDINDWEKLVFNTEEVFDLDFVLKEDAFNPEKSHGTWYLGTHLDQIRIEASDTFFDGRCFTISTNVSKAPHDPIIIALKYPWFEYSPRNKFKFFIHNEEEKVNLIGQYWMARRPNLRNSEYVSPTLQRGKKLITFRLPIY